MARGRTSRHYFSMNGKDESASGGLRQSGRRPGRSVDLRGISFGSPAGIVTSMALIVGLDAATATKAAVVGGLLIIGVADNLTDSLSVHIYQEAERLTERPAFKTTVYNFGARLMVSVSFAALFLLLPSSMAIYACVVWGFFLLSGLSYLLAKQRGARPLSEICKHAGVAAAVIVISKALGLLIRTMIGSI
jgi:VIT1/CCC1 family predicted Fe2+/Mn2+ transporter